MKRTVRLRMILLVTTYLPIILLLICTIYLSFRIQYVCVPYVWLGKKEMLMGKFFHFERRFSFRKKGNCFCWHYKCQDSITATSLSPIYPICFLFSFIFFFYFTFLAQITNFLVSFFFWSPKLSYSIVLYFLGFSLILSFYRYNWLCTLLII